MAKQTQKGKTPAKGGKADKKGKTAAVAPKPQGKKGGRADAQVKRSDEMYVRTAAPEGPPRLKDRYTKQVVPALIKQFNYPNAMAVPRFEKVVLNIGMGEYTANAKSLEFATEDLRQISGQKPVVTRAKKSIAQFRLREGMPNGLMVTLRGRRMFEFLDRLMTLALPRIRDFRGVSDRAFDGRGNYTIGLKEQLIFPEINYDNIDRLRGMNITIVTTAATDEEAKALLKNMGMPFRHT